jgi:Flp pilus assembly protein TadG
MIKRLSGACSLTWSRFCTDRSGAALLIFALVAPVLFLGTAAAVTYADLHRRQSQLQLAADTAVLTAAKELTLANADDERLISVAKQAALAALAVNRPDGTTAVPTPTVVRSASGQRTGLEITIRETVATVMGKVVSLPTSTLQVRSAARLSGSTKVCLIGLDDRLKGTVHLKTSARITAPGCGLYDNSRDREGLIGDDNASVTAALVCSAGGFKEGSAGVTFSPRPLTDCPPIGDPLSSRPAPTYPSACSPVREIRGVTVPPRALDPITSLVTPGAMKLDSGSGVDLSPGLYCHGLKIHGGATVRLQPGIYAFRGPLIVDGSTLRGEGVGLYFEGDRASLLFDHDSSVSLTAPKSGDMAGLLMFEERRVVAPILAPIGKVKGALPLPPIGAPPLREYRIISDDAQTLLGTIYLPSGRLVIDSKKPVAAQSAYTVIVARLIELFDGPNLTLNTNYSATDVPVPRGVGTVTGGAVSLSR